MTHSEFYQAVNQVIDNMPDPNFCKDLVRYEVLILPNEKRYLLSFTKVEMYGKKKWYMDYDDVNKIYRYNVKQTKK